jgi:hypothetical protein
MLNGRARWRACGRRALRLTAVTVRSVSGSGNRLEARGLCRDYYWPWRRGAPYPAPFIRTPKGKYHVCAVEGRAAPHRAKGRGAAGITHATGSVCLGTFTTVGGRQRQRQLTAEIVREIRLLHGQGWSYVRLGARFDVSDDAVRDWVDAELGSMSSRGPAQP